MIKMFSFLLVLTFAIQYEWVQLAPKEVSINILFPEKPAREEKSIRTEVGEIRNISYITNNIEDVNFLYLVNILDYIDLESHSDTSNTAFLINMMEVIKQEYQAKLIYHSEISNNHNEGILYRMSYQNDYFVCKGKLFYIDDKVVSVQVFSKSENSLNEDMDYFLNSLEILE